MHTAAADMTERRKKRRKGTQSVRKPRREEKSRGRKRKKGQRFMHSVDYRADVS